MNYDDDIFEDELELSPEPQNRVILQILDISGNIEDIMFDIEEIYKYVKNLYENCPERS